MLKNIDLDSHSGYATFSWTSLKGMLDNRLVASTYIWIMILPTVLALTSDFPDVISLHPFGSTPAISVGLSIPFNWVLLYYSAVCFAVARAIFVIRCPSFLREHTTVADATANGVTVLMVRDMAAEYLARFQDKRVHPLSDEGHKIDSLLIELIGANKVVEEKFTGVTLDDLSSIAGRTDLSEDFGNDTYRILRSYVTNNAFGTEQEQTVRSKNFLVWKLLDLQNHSFVFTRIAMTLLVLFGGCLLLMPFYQGFLAVWNASPL